ncbi:MAG: hypothetical protein QM790_17435 [Nibricoccus sp.]
MVRPPIFEVSINAAANQLRITLRGAIDAKAMQSCVEDVAKQLPSLKGNFKILTDLSGVQSMDAGSVPHVERLMDLCREKGTALVVRVIPKRSKDVGFNILSLFHYPRTVHIVTCTTLAEAEKALS